MERKRNHEISKMLLYVFTEGKKFQNLIFATSFFWIELFRSNIGSFFFFFVWFHSNEIYCMRILGNLNRNN